MVRHGRLDVDGAIDVARDQLTHGELVEGARGARDRPGVGEDGLDRRVPAGPVGSRLLRGVLLVLSGRVGLDIGALAQARGDEREGRDPFGVVECRELRDHPAHRHADEVDAGQIEDVEQGDGVGDQVVRRVPGRARLVRDGPAGVAVVLADDESRTAREALAKPALPPEHRRRQTHNEQDRRARRVAERLNAEVDAVGAHDRLVGLHPVVSRRGG